MEREFVERFLEMLDIVVNFEDMTAEEKRAAIRDAMNDDDEMNLATFAAWFAPDPEKDTAHSEGEAA